MRWEKITQCDDKVCVRTLGIHMSSALSWNRKFQEVRIKMEESIGKFSSTLMTIQLNHFNVNLCFMPKNYFGCGIMKLTDAQDKKLRRLYEKCLQES